MPIRPDQLALLTHHRWALPALAQLHALGGGAKLVQLVNRLGGHRVAVEQAVEALVELGLVMPNPGYGHPLRPEYIVTPLGAEMGPACARIVEGLTRLDAADVGLRKWTLPTALALDAGAERFGQVRASLVTATDRAVSQCLAAMGGADLVVTRSDAADGRASLYVLSRRVRPVIEIARELPAVA